MIAVVLGASDHYTTAGMLIDRGFATPAAAPGLGERLPRPAFRAADPTPRTAAGPAAGAANPDGTGAGAQTSKAKSDGGFDWGALGRRVLQVLGGLLLVVVLLRRRAVKRRRARRLVRARALADARRRGMIDVIDGERYWGIPNGPAPRLPQPPQLHRTH